MKTTLRTKTTDMAYAEHRRNNPDPPCILCDQDLLIKEYKYWVLLKNRYPYDAVAKRSSMLTTRRHIMYEKELTHEEYQEYLEIKAELFKEYSCVIENAPKNKTIPMHAHYHFLEYFDN